jgi:ATP-dependent Clp protease ATP-binding subunit ClpX
MQQLFNTTQNSIAPRIKEKTPSLPTPREMVAYLDRFVRGQKEAKQALVLAIYRHYLGLESLNLVADEEDEKNSQGLPFGSQHLLLIGPSGSGKSYLIQLIAKFLGVPYSFTSATSLVQTGYVGTSINDLVESLYLRSDRDIAKTQRGIICIDEIDKVKDHGESLDVNGKGVQNALLTILDGRPVSISSTGNRNDSKIDIDTTGILFICAGAFVGLPEIIRTRLSQGKKKSIGFSLTQTDEAIASKSFNEEEILKAVETDDLVSFGFIPEFIGRFSAISVLNALKVEDLLEILVSTKDSILYKKKKLFALHDIELVFTKPALKAIASKALALKTGARALTRVFQDCLTEIEYQLPELAEAGVCKITINKGTVAQGKPLLQYASRQEINLTQIQSLREQFTISNNCPRREKDDNSISSTTGWTTKQFLTRIEEVKAKIDWHNTIGSAKKWWDGFEKQNQQKLALVLRLAEEILIRKATITEFFLAYVYSNTDDIQANLYYFDYTRLKKEEEKKKKEQQAFNIPLSTTQPVQNYLPKQDLFITGEGIEAGNYNVYLVAFKLEKKISILKVLKEITPLGVKEAKVLIDSKPPVLICKGFSDTAATRYKQQLEEAGAEVLITEV